VLGPAPMTGRRAQALLGLPWPAALRDARRIAARDPAQRRWGLRIVRPVSALR
jgi:hypothetical protein